MSISIPFPHTLPRCFGNLSKSVASTYNCRYCFFLPHIVHVLLARLGFPLFFDPSSRKNKQKQIGWNLENLASLVLCFFTCFFYHLKLFSIPACACARLRCLLPNFLSIIPIQPSTLSYIPKQAIHSSEIRRNGFFFPPIFIYFCASPLFLCSCLFIPYSLCSRYARCSSYRTLPYLTLFLSVMFPPLFIAVLCPTTIVLVCSA